MRAFTISALTLFVAACVLACGDYRSPTEAGSLVAAAKGGQGKGKQKSSSLQFDGAQGTETPDHDDLDITSTFTIEGWIRAPSPSGLGDQTILAKWGLSVSASYGVAFENDGRLMLVTHDPAQSPNNTKIFSSGALAAGVWQHFAFVFDNGQAWLYLDGVLDTSCGGALGNCWNCNTGTQTVPNMNTPQVTSSLVTLGRQKSPEGFIGNYYRGLMDEVRIWNVARTARQIQRSVNKEISPKSKGLVAYWRMDEGEGDVAFDMTGNGHDMQLGNAVGPDAADPAWVSPGKL